MSVVLIYRDGRLEPETPLHLEEGQRVIALISEPPLTLEGREAGLRTIAELVAKYGGLPEDAHRHDAYED